MTVTADGLNVFTADSAQGKLLAQLGYRVREVSASGASGLGSPGRRDVVPVAWESAATLGDATLFLVNATDDDVAGYRRDRPVLAALPAFGQGRVYALGPGSFRLDRFAVTSVLDRLQRASGA